MGHPSQHARKRIPGHVPVVDRRQHVVLFFVGVQQRLGDTHGGELEAGESSHERLDGDSAGFKHRPSFGPRQGSRRTVDVQAARAGDYLTLIQCDGVTIDFSHMAESHDVLDRSHQIEFSLTDERAPIHARLHVGVDAQHESLCLQTRKQITNRRGLRGGFQLECMTAIEIGHERGRLHKLAVDPPALPRLDPADRFRRNSLFEQPDTGIERRLSAADDDKIVRSLLESRNATRWHTPYAVCHLERWCARGGNVALEIRRIDDFARRSYVPALTGQS